MEDIEPLTISGAALELDCYRSKRQGKFKGKEIEREDVQKVRDYLKERLNDMKAATYSYSIHKDPVIRTILNFYGEGRNLQEYAKKIGTTDSRVVSANLSTGLQMIVEEFDRFEKSPSKMKISDISTLVHFCITLSRETSIAREREHDYPLGKRYIA